MKIDINNDVAEVSCNTKKSKDDPVGTECFFTFDLTTWSKEQIVELALKSLIIKAQAQFRKGTIKADAMLNCDAFASRKPKKTDKATALEYVQRELATGRDIADIMAELEGADEETEA